LAGENYLNKSDRNKYHLIYQTVKQIPKGKVATYGEIAKLCGLIGQARQVGYALHSTPPHLKVPWQRVINAQGKISFPKTSDNYRKQKKLLQQDGIVFKNNRIDLEKYGWPRKLEKLYKK
jgi:methylated-DNA-protein-cysteine methyltransferase-like protein